MTFVCFYSDVGISCAVDVLNVTSDTHGTNEKCDTLLVRKYHGKSLL